ncbi:hypothetical protein [Saccharococcus caldoxylosilyticus]|uniref:hypothetical protein n=1 Tax=Saccharococcus caldoxylosilyticus TaxID=81408 RepID=UPI001FCAB168|nr:hypothetical protein [Parageobacillus caldoxylosilyticus]BDG45435.1 hypothetical protein PcaKH35_37800 [Parageobacillus caldoxylosilyticus]
MFEGVHNPHKLVTRLGQHVSHKIVKPGRTLRSREELQRLDLEAEAWAFVEACKDYGWWDKVVGFPPDYIIGDIVEFMRDRIPKAYYKWTESMNKNHIDSPPSQLDIDVESFWNTTA